VYTYLVRLTVEGEHEEQEVLAQNAAHAIRQAMTLWWHLEPAESAVVSARRLSDQQVPYEPRRSLATPGAFAPVAVQS
jgi:hypothetical protein